MADSPLWLSLRVATIATLFAAVLGIAFGTLLAQNRFRGRNLADALVTAPMVLPPTVLGYYLLVALGRHSAIGHAYEALTGSSIVFTRTGAVVAAAVGAFPIMVKSSRAALEDVDPVFVRAARTLGAGPVRAFFTVQLPLAARGVLAAVMLSFARSLGDFGVTLMVAGDIPRETQTASLAIYDAIQSHREEEAAQMVIVLSVVAIGILYLVNRLTMRRGAR
ncbi:MAG: molybdate ABC transporter permease subunit [Polyangiaceae bacterium]